jgi:hypothetical protein
LEDLEMATGVLGDQARFQPQQVINTWRTQVNYNDPAIASGRAGVTIPQGAFITSVLVEIVTGFNAATTNVLTLGSAPNYNNLLAAADIAAPGTPGITSPTRGIGRSLTAAGDLTIGPKYTQTGAAATAGQAEIVVQYEANTG